MSGWMDKPERAHEIAHLTETQARGLAEKLKRRKDEIVILKIAARKSLPEFKGHVNRFWSVFYTPGNLADVMKINSLAETLIEKQRCLECGKEIERGSRLFCCDEHWSKYRRRDVSAITKEAVTA